MGHSLLLLIFQNTALNLALNINIWEWNVKHSSWTVNNFVYSRGGLTALGA